MKVEELMKQFNIDFCSGVPDSQLKPLCNFLGKELGISNKHIIAANEGNSTAIAAGYYMATGKIPLVYMQNSGIGNAINPIVSLLNESVYGIPCVFVVGWRGQPGYKDEPQHLFQGEITKKLLEDVGVYVIVLQENTNIDDLQDEIKSAKELLKNGNSVAILVGKNVLEYEYKLNYSNVNTIVRESAIKEIVNVSNKDVVVSTTGKISRELYEIREQKKQSHKYDFLTVGSMGHSSSIALGIAMNKPNTKVWVIDGDGALLMHMGAMAVIGSNAPENLIHIVLNNESHETVGGMPTVANNIDLLKIAEGCGYKYVTCVRSIERLRAELDDAKTRNVLTFVEIKCTIGSREDLGRPTTPPKQNKDLFMKYLQTLN